MSRKGQRFTERLRNISLQSGDLLVLKGNLAQLPERLKELGCLPLAEREIRLGNVRRGIIPVAVLGGAMGLTAVGVLPVAIAFFTAATLMVLLGALSLREAYNAVQWPILVMLGALIPVSETIQTSGAADLTAGALSRLAQSLPSYGAVALIMIGAMAVTPFLNNAATVLVMAPIAASFAGQLGYRPDRNTLVMGPGGYRFGDYWRLGAPLSLLVVVLGVPLIVLVWPLVR